MCVWGGRKPGAGSPICNNTFQVNKGVKGDFGFLKMVIFSAYTGGEAAAARIEGLG